jgi:hypothetical protein
VTSTGFSQLFVVEFLDSVEPFEYGISSRAESLSRVGAIEIEMLLAIRPVNVDEELVDSVANHRVRHIVLRDIPQVCCVQDLLELLKLGRRKRADKHFELDSVAALETVLAAPVNQGANILMSLKVL